MSRSDPGSWRTGVVERVSRADPGLLRLRFAFSGALAIGLAIGAEYLFVSWTGALRVEVPAGGPAAVVAQLAHVNHRVVVIADLLGVLAAFLCSLTALELNRRAQLVSMTWVGVSLVAGLTVAVALSPWRTWSLVALVATLGAAAYVRAYGSRGFAASLGLFLGYFAGFTLGSSVPIGRIGWPIAEIGVGVLVAVVVKLVILPPDPDAAARRLNRSFGARATGILLLAEVALTAPGSAVDRRLRRQLAQHNQAGLMFDATSSHAGRGSTPFRTEPERVFDMEHAVAELGHSSHLVAAAGVPAHVRATMRLAVIAVRHGDRIGATVLAAELEATVSAGSGRHVAAVEIPRGERGPAAVVRFARAVVAAAEAIEAWQGVNPGVGSAHARGQRFAPSPLLAGWLPGTSIVSARASAGPQPRAGYTHLRLRPHLRAAIQMTVAGTLALVVGDAVSPPHLIWAVLTVFLLFMGPLNAAEQVSRALLRVVGTVAAVLAVVVLVHLFGDGEVAGVIIVVLSAFLGMYLMRSNAVFLVFGLTILTSELYVQLQLYSDALIRIRIEEIAVGAASVIITVLLVVPLHHSRVLRTALQVYLVAAADLLAAFEERLTPAADAVERDRPTVAETIKPLVRHLDAAYQSLLGAVVPPARPLWGPAARRATAIGAAAERSRGGLRRAANGLRELPLLGDTDRRSLAATAATVAAGLGAIFAFLGDDVVRAYPKADPAAVGVRAVRVGHRLDARSTSSVGDALRDLDGCLAELAALLGLPVVGSAPGESTCRAAAGDRRQFTHS